MNEERIARKNAEGCTQSLCDHMRNVGQISAALSRFPHTSALIAYLHDLGKLSAAFQRYIQNPNSADRGSVIHAWQGAFFLDELETDSGLSAILLREIVSFCVTAHHSHLHDGLSPDGSTDFFDKLQCADAPKYAFDEIKVQISDENKSALRRLFKAAQTEMASLLEQINTIYEHQKSAYFALGMAVKYLFSCLVDADRLDAYLFEVNEPYRDAPADWDGLIEVFEGNLAKIKSTPPMGEIRRAVSEKCRKAAERETGIYQLAVPTGGGKTLSSLRFALHHCKKHGKKRIIYVIPYLSIIEQTAENLRHILDLAQDSDVLFEHHSNIIVPEDEKAADIRKLSAARWTNPLILTTMVQFLESVMSAKSGALRKLAALADSVIIFDEIQSMPLKAIHCFNEAATFLSRVLGATIILCSATQPALEATQRQNLMLHKNPKLIDGSADFRGIKRVRIVALEEKGIASAAAFVTEKARENGNCLVIVNTKRAALDLYSRLKAQKDGFSVLHLSTAMHPLHRAQILSTMRQSLDRVICVSTQLIEAGVDISFACVVRAMAGLDSIAQAAGRCNRHGDSPEPKTVYTFPLKDENLDKLADIRSGKEVTAQLVRTLPQDTDLLDETVMAAFYRQYFTDKNSQMDCPRKEGGSIYSLLSDNLLGQTNYTNKTGAKFSPLLVQAFRTAGDAFHVIDQNTTAVVVMTEEVRELAEKYRQQPAGLVTKSKLRILRTLQKYSVSLYKWELEHLKKQRALSPLDKEQCAFSQLDEETGVLLLNEAYYSKETGVLLEIPQEDYIV